MSGKMEIRPRPVLPTYEEHVNKYRGGSAMRSQSSASDRRPAVDDKDTAAVTHSPNSNSSRQLATRTLSATTNGYPKREVLFSNFSSSNQQKPPKPPRRGKVNGIYQYFPAPPTILEHPRTLSHYGSCGYFSDYFAEPATLGPTKGKLPIRHQMGSSPNLVDFIRTGSSCVSLNGPGQDRETPINRAAPIYTRKMNQNDELLGGRNRNRKAASIYSSVDCGLSRAGTSSAQSQPPVDHSLKSNYSSSSLDYLHSPTPSSASKMSSLTERSCSNMSSSSADLARRRIRTNGSFPHLLLLQTQSQQLRRTPTLTDSQPHFVITTKECGILDSTLLSNSDHPADNVSLASISSSLASAHSEDSGSASASDSGKASSSQHSALDGVSTSHHDELEEDLTVGLAGISGNKITEDWKTLPNAHTTSKVPPWNQSNIKKILQGGRLRSLNESGRLSIPANSTLIPYLSQLLCYPFDCLCAEISRLAKSNHHRCTKRDVLFAAQRLLPFNLFSICKTACHQAGAFYASTLSGDQGKMSKSTHAGLEIDVGRIQGYLIREQIAKFIHDLAAVYLAAIIQTVLEEFILSCVKGSPTEKIRLLRSASVSPDPSESLTCKQLEMHSRSSMEFIGVFYPWGHLSPEKNLTEKSDYSDGIYYSQNDVKLDSSIEDVQDSVWETCRMIEDSRKDRVARTSSSAMEELTIGQMHWSSDALVAVQYYLRDIVQFHCKKPDGTLMEWLRVIEACAAYRRSSMIEKDDVLEAARILLPSSPSATVDYPPHLLSLSDELHYFQAISKPRLLNDFNQAGLTPLMVACIRGDYSNVKALITAGAKVNLSIPPMTTPNNNSKPPTYTRIKPDMQQWTALHLAVAHGFFNMAKYLLDNGAHVEGSTDNDNSNTLPSCETPLQIAVAQGNEEMTTLLLARGADPCISSVSQEASFGVEAQRGTQSALILAAAHGRRKCLMKILTVFSSASPISKSDDCVSLEEILQEASGSPRKSTTFSPPPTKSVSNHGKVQQKVLNAALYSAIESGFLEIAFQLLQAGALWRVHTWMRALDLIAAENASLKSFLEGFWSLPLEEVLEWSELTSSTLPALLALVISALDQGEILSALFQILWQLYGDIPLELDQTFPIATVNHSNVFSTYHFAQKNNDVELEKWSLHFLLHNLPQLFQSQSQLLRSAFCADNQFCDKLQVLMKERLEDRRKLLLANKLRGSV